ncbi:MAG: HAMP domain-containing histidine kinase, partial [Marmoricola sp.]|nr:HAMP domain-containing histidine kinase [Marmoricola sp.]
AGGRRLEVSELPHARALEGESVPVDDYLVRSPECPEGVVLEIGATHLPSLRSSEPGLAVVNFRDVTDDRRERDNLAAFAGVVAHDLSNPLSVVNGWAEALLDEFALGAVDSVDGTAMVSRVKEAATQMQQFITDLLSYTVARDQALRLEKVDLSGLAESVASMRRESSSRPRISIQPGLEVFADVALTRQLLDNLIGNAVKYVAPGVRPRIDVSAVDRGDYVCVMVCDNGIGVPADRRRDIFENFQRAHAGDYSGTGIGLAICQRIVERHGGRIEVEDNPFGNGSLFSFTLPSPSVHHEPPVDAPAETAALQR